jgi:peptidylprolyl isomerase domain and WD repeat-containing protein 1
LTDTDGKKSRIENEEVLLEETAKQITEEEPPTKKSKNMEKTLKYEGVYLRAIPRANQYEKSFMHRDTITHVIATE